MNRFRSIVIVLLLVVGFVVAARIVATGARLIHAPIETTGQEAAQPIIASAVSRGEPLYRDWRQPPHALAIYGPLTYVLPAAIARLQGATPWETWIIGRMVSVAAAVSALAMCVILMHRAGVRPSLIALGVFVLIPVMNIWSVAFTFRADMGMIACGLAGLVVAGDWRGRSKWWSVPLFLAAIAYKQHALAAPAAIFFFLILERRLPEAIRFAIVMAAAGIAYVGFMQVVTHGWFFSNAFGAASAAYSIENVTSNLRRFILAFPLIALPGAWLVIRRARRHQLDPVSLFCVVSFLIATLLSGRTGSDVNYFIEGFVGLSVLSMVFAEEQLRALANTKASTLAFAGMALVAVCYIPMDRYPTPPALLLSAGAYDDPATHYREALAATNGAKVFSGELSAAVLADIQPLYSDGFILDEMIASGRGSAETIVAEFRAQGYTYALVPDRVPEWQHLSVVPRVLLAELEARADKQSAVKVAELGGGRSLYLIRLSRGIAE